VARKKGRSLIPTPGSIIKFALKNHLLTAFLVLCVFGVVVGVRTRPVTSAIPWDEVFSEMTVASYRESPSDTVARFVIDLAAGGRVFRRYDVDSRTFLPPPRSRDYNRTITGTLYRPLRVRGHLTQGLWLDVPREGRSLLPEQFQELYRATLDYVKPVAVVAGVAGTLSGYSVGYRLGSWNSSLRSRAVQERVLAAPDVGRMITREAWRRVLLEPAVMGAEDDAARFTAVHGTQRVYANFFRVALNDSDGFIPREASRLARLGRLDESRAMSGFLESVHRAGTDSVHLSSADFGAIERWASLLARRGHWAREAIPPSGEERALYLGMLSWYGVAPPGSANERVWIGPRLLVREGETDGFIADDIPSTRVGGPLAWHAALEEERSGMLAAAGVWFSDHPEFVALVRLGSLETDERATATRRLPMRPAAADTVPVAAHDTTRVDSVIRVPVDSLTAAPARADSAPEGLAAAADTLDIP
jgi:hypothetical protein